MDPRTNLLYFKYCKEVAKQRIKFKKKFNSLPLETALKHTDPYHFNF